MSSETFEKIRNSHVRRSILECLQASSGGTSNDHVLRDVLARRGLVCTRDEVRAHLASLSSDGLIDLTSIDLLVATLTAAGSEAAKEATDSGRR